MIQIIDKNLGTWTPCPLPWIYPCEWGERGRMRIVNLSHKADSYVVVRNVKVRNCN